MHFGIREHAMGAILNGMALHRGLIPYGATFLIFSDYMRPPMRLAAMNGLPVIYVFTHDSIAMGEDGPTHQPVEQLVGLRSSPAWLSSGRRMPTKPSPPGGSPSSEGRSRCSGVDSPGTPRARPGPLSRHTRGSAAWRLRPRRSPPGARPTSF